MGEEESGKTWWVYIVECGDGSLYCGIALDVEQRMRDHATPKGSRYVRSHGGVKRVLWRISTGSRSAAQSLEIKIKQMSRMEKKMLAMGGPFGAGMPMLQTVDSARPASA